MTAPVLKVPPSFCESLKSTAPRQPFLWWPNERSEMWIWFVRFKIKDTRLEISRWITDIGPFFKIGFDWKPGFNRQKGHLKISPVVLRSVFGRPPASERRICQRL